MEIEIKETNIKIYCHRDVHSWDEDSSEMQIISKQKNKKNTTITLMCKQCLNTISMVIS